VSKLCIATIVACLLTACGGLDEDFTNVVQFEMRGTVVDVNNDQPVSGIRVSILEVDSLTKLGYAPTITRDRDTTTTTGAFSLMFKLNNPKQMCTSPRDFTLDLLFTDTHARFATKALAQPLCLRTAGDFEAVKNIFVRLSRLAAAYSPSPVR
jgi:hypothetical protein